jgi:hypothetical protein
MKTATSLTLLAIGAILAFAVTAHPSFFSFRVAGWVLMVIGAVGAVLPRRGNGWLRRRVVLTGTRRRVVVDRGHRAWQLPKLLQNGVVTRQQGGIPPLDPVDVLVGNPASGDEAVDEDTIEQYIEE